MAAYYLKVTWTAHGHLNHDPVYDASGNLSGGYAFRRSMAIKVANTPGHVVTGPGGNPIGNYIKETPTGPVWIVQGLDADITAMIATWEGHGYVKVTEKTPYP
jgi:hypothetical protein